MHDRAFLAAGVVGAVVTALCCTTPLLLVVFGAAGLTAWLVKAHYILIPALVLCLGLIGFGLHRKRLREW